MTIRRTPLERAKGGLDMRILVVEDERRIPELVKAALLQVGFAVDAVAYANDAKEALAANPYDAVILYLGLPDGDGIDMLRAIRSAGNGIPILILTARDAI